MIIIPTAITLASIIALAIIVYDDLRLGGWEVKGVVSILAFAICLMGNVLMWAIWETLK